MRATTAHTLKFKKSKLNKAQPGRSVAFTILFILFVLYALTLLYPMTWMLLSSLKSSVEYKMSSPFSLPQGWLFSNYLEAFSLLELNGTSFLGMTFNSLWMSGLSIVIGVFVSALSSYVVAKLDFPGRRLIYLVILLQMMIPTYGSLASSFKLIKAIHTFDTPIHVIISSFAVGGYKFLILYAFFKSVSWSYAEAAYIDGASHAQVFFKVMFPQAIAPLMTFAMTDFIVSWNDYMSPLIWMPSYPTLASGLFEYEMDMIRMTNYPVFLAGVVISIIPIIILFITFQDTFMTSLSMGGLKG